MSNEFILTRTTALPLEKVCARLPEISAAHKFGVLGVHNLREKMESKGVPFARECRVFEVCNPGQAARVLGEAIEIATALPCRISVWEEGGQTVLATIKPSLLLTMFHAPGAATTAQEVEEMLVKIMDETCRV